MMDNRAEIRIALEQRPFLIPYNPAKMADGEIFEYRSLVRHPESIDDIPELKGETGMKEFIRQVNAPGGVFETARMVHWIVHRPSGDFQRSICLGFIFRDRRLFGQYSNCLMFAGNLLHLTCVGILPCDEPFLIEIQQARLWEEDKDGWIMDLYVAGIGNSEESARCRLDNNLAKMTPLMQNGEG